MTIQLFTMGLDGKSAEKFFSLLRQYRIRNVIDVRLKNLDNLDNHLQPAGIRQDDSPCFLNILNFRNFLHKLLNVNYMHRKEFAPAELLLENYKKGVLSWEEYENWYYSLLLQRQPQQYLFPPSLDHACLLGNEDEPTYCHRRLAADYLKHFWPDISIQHICSEKNHEASLSKEKLHGHNETSTTAVIDSFLFA